MRVWITLCTLLFTLGFVNNPAGAACVGPTGVPGDIIYNSTHNTFQGCTGQGWFSFHPPSASAAPPGCPNVGDVCTSGAINAGVHNGHLLLVAANDAPSVRAWGPNPSTTGLVICEFAGIATSGCDTGYENTQTLKGHASTFPAAEYCADLNAHGHNAGWYLPAYNEMWHIHNVLKQGKPEGTHNFLHADYWLSTEDIDHKAWYMNFNGAGDATFLTHNKAFPKRVRCARHG